MTIAKIAREIIEMNMQAIEDLMRAIPYSDLELRTHEVIIFTMPLWETASEDLEVMQLLDAIRNYCDPKKGMTITKLPDSKIARIEAWLEQ